jgi:multidrug efflux pump subunit AcrA (membrane-fusion protein)
MRSVKRAIAAVIALSACAGASAPSPTPGPKPSDVIAIAPPQQETIADAGTEAAPSETPVAAPPPPNVRVLEAEVQVDESHVTHVHAARTGIVRSVLVTPGARVAVGARLLEIDVDEISGATVTLRKAQSALAAANHQLLRVTELRRFHAASTRDYEEARAQYDEAVRALVEARRSLRTRGSTIAALAPRAGEVIALAVKAGDRVVGDEDLKDRGTELATVGDLDRVVIVASAIELNGIQNGATATFHSPRFPAIAWYMKIEVVAGELLVRAAVDNFERHLRPGMVGLLYVLRPDAP